MSPAPKHTDAPRRPDLGVSSAQPKAGRRLALRNSPAGYGLVAICLHWLIALAVIGLFTLGVWMTDLGYYDPWYRSAPALHKGIGVILFLTMLIRVLWRVLNVRPDAEPGLGVLKRKIADAAHILLYLLLFAVMTSGYLISTADGRPIDVFGLFAVPAVIANLPNQEDLAGVLHWYLALALIALAGLHALAALKHHFIDRDRILMKMLGLPSRRRSP